MKTLLSAIKTQLQTSLKDVRAADVFIVPHINYLPGAARMPCVALKDGRITRSELTGGAIAETMWVAMAVYVNLRKEEASIMGDLSAGQKGVLELVSDIHTVLHQNMLAIPGMISAFCQDEQEAEMFGDDTAVVERKIINYQYDKESY